MFLIPPSKIVVLAILEPPKLFFLMVRAECVSCTWALQAEHSGHYFWHYFVFFLPGHILFSQKGLT